MGGYFRPRTKSTESANALCALFYCIKNPPQAKACGGGVQIYKNYFMMISTAFVIGGMLIVIKSA